MSTLKYTLSIAVFIICLLSFNIYTGYRYEFELWVYPVRFGLIGLILFASYRFLLSVKGSSYSEHRKNATVGIVAFIFIFSVAEIVFMFIPRTHGGDKTLASRVWYHYYWKHNSLWYRDKEYDPESAKNKFKIAILGDSFVAGHGIKSVNNRFSDLLQKRLGDEYVVFNLGHNGSDTQDELNRLKDFPIKPDFLVLCHLPNDIAFIPTVYESGLIQIPAFFVAGSYLLNYFVFKFEEFGRKHAHSLYGNELEKEHVEFLKSGEAITFHLAMFLNADSVEVHKQRLSDIVNYCDSSHIEMGVVLFPEIWKTTLDFSEEYVNAPLADFFNAKGIPCLDTYNLFSAIPEKERVVNFNDAHPSEKAHSAIADSLFHKFQLWIHHDEN